MAACYVKHVGVIVRYVTFITSEIELCPEVLPSFDVCLSLRVMFNKRDALQDVVTKWNAQVGEGLDARVELVRWENHAKPEMGGSPQEILNSQIVDDCDLGIAVFWSKLGTPTDDHPSGSVEEIHQLVERGARVMVYFSEAPVPQDKIDNDQFERLKKAKEEFLKEGLLFEYETVSNLKEMVQLHLTSAISEILITDRTGKN